MRGQELKIGLGQTVDVEDILYIETYIFIAVSHVTCYFLISSHVSFGRWALCSQPVPVQGSCSQAFDTLTMKYLEPHGIRKDS